MTTMKSFLPAIGACAFTLACCPTPASAQDVVRLPDYTVRADRVLPLPESWRYTRIPGFEVLSSVSEGETRRILHDLQELRSALDVVWPGMQRGLPRDSLLILCGGNRFSAFIPEKQAGSVRTTLSLRDSNNSALVINQGSAVVSIFGEGAAPSKDVDLFGLGYSNPPSNQSVLTPANSQFGERFGIMQSSIDLMGPESGGVGFFPSEGLQPFLVVQNEVEVDHRGQQQREYIHFLFTQLDQPPPAWLEEGVARLFMMMDVSKKEISFAVPRYDVEDTVMSGTGVEGVGSVTPDFITVGEKEFTTALSTRALLPMDKFFAIARDSGEAQDVVTGRWAHQSAAFVHWGLYGYNGANRKDFLKFVERSYREPVTEQMVRECFGLDFAKLALALRGYIQKPVYQQVTFVAHGGGLKAPETAELREATQAEIGRIKGVALRLAGNEAAAHATLATAYARGERDPNLLAELGVQEMLTGTPERGRPLLEAATKGKTSSTQAYLSLARLRLAEFRAKPAGAGGRLDVHQTVAVLEPLFAARSSAPKAEVYDLIAETWQQSAIKPRAEHLAVLQEGLARFPYDFKLLYQAADLYVKNNYREDAAPLVRAGLNFKNAAFRARFENLQALLARQ
jgi:hypothetical protein